MFLPLLHDSPREFFWNFWSERLRRCLISSKNHAISKKKYIYLSIYWSLSKRCWMSRELERRIFIMRHASLLGAFIIYSAIACYWTWWKTVEHFAFPPSQSLKIPLELNIATSFTHYPAFLRPLHNNAAYAISIFASPEHAVGAIDGIEKKVSSALKVSEARPGLRMKC